MTVNVRGTGLSGYEIASGLFAHGVIVEMATPDVVLFLVSPGVTDALVDDTLQTLKDLTRRAPARRFASPVFEPPEPPIQVLTPRQALLADRERVPKDKAVGRVSGETIGCYPPGQAIFVAGERVNEAGVEYLTRAVSAGGHLKRVQDDGFRTIEVICDRH